MMKNLSIDEKSLDSFISQKCKEYCKGKNDNKTSDVIEEERKLLGPLYDALKCKYTECLRVSELLGALEKLSVANTKFFSIFLGVGTGKYYKKAMKDIINDSSNIELFAGDILVNIINKQILVGNIKSGKAFAEEVDAECKKRCKCYLVKEFTRKIKNKIGVVYDLLKKSSNPKGPYKTFILLNYDHSDEDYKKHKKFLEDLKSISEKLSLDSRAINAIDARIKTVDAKINHITELASVASQTDFENNRGIYNGGNRCYLITALQSLYGDKEFVQKVIGAKPPSEGDEDFEFFKELVATKIVFLYLKNGTNEKEFKDGNGKWVKDWSKWLGYNGSQQSSEWWQRSVETACRNQMRALKKYLGSSYALELAFQGFRRNRRSNISIFISIDDESLNNKGKALKNILLSLEKNKDKSKIEGNIATWLKTLGYNKESNLKAFIDDISKNIYDKAIAGKSLNQNNVKSTGLSSAISSLTIQQIHGTNISDIIENYCLSKFGDMDNVPPTVLALKNKKFQIILSDRGYNNPNPRSPKIKLYEVLDLTKLDLIGTQLFIYDGSKLLDKNKCKFKLVSVTIGTGRHYYIYRKVGSQWKKFNDKDVTNNVKWKEIRDVAGGMAETLVYSL